MANIFLCRFVVEQMGLHIYDLIVGSRYQSLKKMDDMDSPTLVVQPNKCIVMACVASKCKATN
jgi:hypothetical protein